LPTGGLHDPLRHNQAEFRTELERVQASSEFFLNEAVLPEGDASPTLQRLGHEYGMKIAKCPS